MNKKLKKNIVKAIDLLCLINENKWVKEEISIRTVSALSLAKHYIKEAEKVFNAPKNKK